MAPGGLLKAITVYGDLTSSDEEGQRAEQEFSAQSRQKCSPSLHPFLERYDILEGRRQHRYGAC